MRYFHQNESRIKKTIDVCMSVCGENTLLGVYSHIFDEIFLASVKSKTQKHVRRKTPKTTVVSIRPNTATIDAFSCCGKMHHTLIFFNSGVFSIVLCLS